MSIIIMVIIPGPLTHGESIYNRFSSKPKKAIKFLQEKKLLSLEPEEVARLFHTDERFSKIAVGDYMGEGDE